jgi:hypothetical protein
MISLLKHRYEKIFFNTHPFFFLRSFRRGDRSMHDSFKKAGIYSQSNHTYKTNDNYFKSTS